MDLRLEVLKYDAQGVKKRRLELVFVRHHAPVSPDDAVCQKQVHIARERLVRYAPEIFPPRLQKRKSLLDIGFREDHTTFGPANPSDIQGDAGQDTIDGAHPRDAL